jgi:hypothetical protein
MGIAEKILRYLKSLFFAYLQKETLRGGFVGNVGDTPI